MIKPNLFIVGQPKSGTTALHYFLEQHPEIFMSKPKEPHFFCKDFHEDSDRFHGKAGSKKYFPIRTMDEYLGLFTTKKEYKIFGEASTNYLYSKVAANFIHKFNPDAKIIMIFREPVSFLYSLHSQYVNATSEDIGIFGNAFNLSEDRKNGKNIPVRARCPLYVCYSERVDYVSQIERYFNNFPEDQIKIIIFDDFRKDNERIYKEILKFLNVDENILPDFKGIHESKIPKNRFLNKFLRNPHLKNIPKSILPPKLYDSIQLKVQDLLMRNQQRIPIDPNLKFEIMKKFKPEIEKFSDFLKRNLVDEWEYNKV